GKVRKKFVRGYIVAYQFGSSLGAENKNALTIFARYRVPEVSWSGGQLDRFSANAVKGARRFAHSPNIFSSAVSRREEEICPVRCPNTAAFVGGIRPVRQQAMKIFSVGGNFPDRACAGFIISHVEPQAVAVG